MRPWTLKVRRYFWRSEKWGKWRTHATYKTREAAEAGEEKQKLFWAGAGYQTETQIIGREPGEEWASKKQERREAA